MAYDLTHKPSEPRWVTAVFESQDDARKAQDDLVAVGIEADDIEIRSTLAHATDPNRPAERTGFFRALLDIFVFMPSEDRVTLEEALRRGGVALAVRVSPELYEQAIDTLDRDGAIDLEEREMSAAQGSHKSTVPWTRPGAPLSGTMMFSKIPMPIRTCASGSGSERLIWLPALMWHRPMP